MAMAAAREGRWVPPAGRTPAVPNAVLGVLVFVGAAAMLFAGLVSAFVVLRAGMGVWPPADQPRFPLAVTTLNTLVLLASGGVMYAAHAASRAGRQAEAVRRLGLTAALGVAFLAVQGVEWVRLVGHGLRIVGGVYGGLFAALIGTHGVHVLGGVVALLLVRRAVARGDGPARPAAVAAAGIYWGFVVALWLVLFTLVYLW